MITRKAADLHFQSSRDPKPTVEVRLDTVQGQIFSLNKIVAAALRIHARKNPKSKATIYTYMGRSVNFHEAAQSVFLIVAGPESIVIALGNAFAKLESVQSRYSDYMLPKEGFMEYHIEDGYLWEPADEEFTWYAVDGGASGAAENGQQTPIQLKAATSTTPESAEDADVNCENTSNEASVAEVEPTAQQQIVKAARYRAARADARVGGISKEIERVFGLPTGSVALCGPDDRPLRSDAFISTLRKRWADA